MAARTTHSPYIFEQRIGASALIIGKKNATGVNLQNADPNQWLFSEPSWGELSYHAYDLATFEYHNELYGWLQERTGSWMEDQMETFLVSQGCVQNKNWARDRNGQLSTKSRTIMTYIRNFTHHPENTHNQPYSETELQDSISKMYAIAQTLR